MKISAHHSWNVTPAEAKAIQDTLRGEVITEDRLGPVQFVGGVDVAFEANGRITRAAVAVLTYPALELHEYVATRQPTCFPYVPGLLSFREIPAVLEALQRLKQLPTLILCDGQGYAHPRRFGLACHLGVLTGMISIGVAKTRLVGCHEPVSDERGAWQPLRDKDEIIGAVLRTRAGVKPVYVSIGHRVCLETAIALVMACTKGFRLPETTRWAHRLASARPTTVP
ncbi:MAG: deoxyribonuclease V [Gammaproteobacteria bacterium]|nr:deoxyribonuclease V [Gammaproteobacteria bacterium]MCI0590796.1 deoxyribonuclease V [Gammaproteobacteria bacterium]